MLRGLRRAAARLEAEGLAVPPLRGKLLRPRLAAAAAPTTVLDAPDDRFWYGALAVQMVHEASLLHDDIVDGAPLRRGAATDAARDGTASALIRGDRYLTASYRAARRVGSPGFLDDFLEAVDDTVVGEIAQGAARGRRLEPHEYRRIVEGKSGALLGAALALAAHRFGHVDVAPARALGVRIGALYQMVDDLLDYCPALHRGKAPLADARQEKWTFVLEALGADALGRSPEETLQRLTAGGATSALEGALAAVEAEAAALIERARGLLGESRPVRSTLQGWVVRAREGVSAQLDAARRRCIEAAVAEDARALGGPAEWDALFQRHSRSFHFSARLFSRELRDRITGVYVYCRFTDDLVDEAGGGTPEPVRDRLEAWRALSRRAYDGEATGVPLLDRVLGTAAARGVPFGHVSDLLDGVAMDLKPRVYRDLEDLRGYTYRVASTVGAWITESLGVHEPRALERAHALGHAMQLTNIMRDVGEDLQAGRLYLPLDRLRAHGLTRADLERAALDDGPCPPALADLLEELMEVADSEYERALGGLHHLPAGARIAVSAAARIYRGIHREIRRNDHDVLTRRAFTGPARKAWLAALGAGDPRALAGATSLLIPTGSPE